MAMSIKNIKINLRKTLL